MKIFKKRGEMTHFQILAEIAKQEPHLRQKDIADELGITVQAVSENLKSLLDAGFVESGTGRSPYKITKRGIDKLKKQALDLRKYSETVLDTMNTYKSIWPAIASENLNSGDRVGLFMDDGTLYATKASTSAQGEVLNDAQKGEDVALMGLEGIIELKTGKVVILNLPTIQEGGSRATDLEKIKKIYHIGFDRVGIMGTVSRAVADKLDIKVDFEFATPYSTLAATKRGLNVLVFAVGKMNRSITNKLEEEGIHYSLEDVKKDIN